MANNTSKELFKAKEVGERVREIRKEKELSREDMADVLNSVLETYKDFELGKTDKPRLKMIKPFFKEWDISLDYIVFGTEPKHIHIDDKSCCEKDEKDIGVRLYRLREKEFMTRDELSEELGICKRTIVRYENATTRRVKKEDKKKGINNLFINGDNFSIEFLCRYSRHFNTSLNYIVFNIK